MNFNTSRLAIYAGLLAMGASVGIASPVKAADFSGKKITLIVPFKEGGGGNRYGRMWQPFLEKYLPGNPKVLVVNKPGGGSIKGNNWFERNAKNDGSMLIVCSSSTYTSFVFGGKKVKFNMLNWRPIIASPLGLQYYARADTGIKGKDIVADIKTLRKGKWHAAAKTPTSAELHQYLSYHVLGINNVTPVFGLSSGRRRKATLRGELQLTYDSTGAFLKKAKKYVKNGAVVHYMTLGFALPDGSVGRDPAFPNLPTVWDVYEKLNGKKLTGLPSRGLKHLLNMVGSGSKSLMLPKGASDEMVNAYVKAVKMILKDKKFMKIAKKEIGDYPQAFGKDADNIVKNAVDLKPDMKKWMKNWINKQFNVSL